MKRCMPSKFRAAVKELTSFSGRRKVEFRHDASELTGLQHELPSNWADA